MRHIPNIICILRIILVWPIAVALSEREYLLTLALFILAGASDGVDGFLAKRFNWTSELGKFLDPAADKILLVCVFVSATWMGLVPVWLTAAAVARDAMIALGALTFRLWFGALHGRPTILSKLNTGAQIIYLLGVLAQHAFALPGRAVVAALAIAALITTTLSGMDYIVRFTRRALALPARP